MYLSIYLSIYLYIYIYIYILLMFASAQLYDTVKDASKDQGYQDLAIFLVQIESEAGLSH